jgi:hydrogenase nickel incorporation protein HypA/HybF
LNSRSGAFEVMHELSIALSILDLATEEVQRHGAVRVLGIQMRLGCLSGVVKESLASAFELAREGTSFEETALVIEEVPVLVNCPSCRAKRAVVSVQELCCIECGTPSPDVASGRELELVALEIQ